MQPSFVFAGELFEFDPDFKQAKSMLLDLLRGRVVDALNLMVCCLDPEIKHSSQLCSIQNIEYNLQ